jgi:hypothetical protein
VQRSQCALACLCVRGPQSCQCRLSTLSDSLKFADPMSGICVNEANRLCSSSRIGDMRGMASCVLLSAPCYPNEAMNGALVGRTVRNHLHGSWAVMGFVRTQFMLARRVANVRNEPPTIRLNAAHQRWLIRAQLFLDKILRDLRLKPVQATA